MIFVIAEIGVNWDGDFELVKKMMRYAKEAGCNAVKFQAYNEDAVKDHPQKLRLIKSAISRTNVGTIDKLAKSVGIEWFCTPMYPDAVDFLEPFVSRFKIRELDGRPLLNNEITPLLEKVLKTNKQVIISCNKSPQYSKYYEDEQIKWLYCVPKYPCDLREIDFRKLKNFDGYSNHCPDIIAPITASILGASIIEIHITSDKSREFLDNNVSFDYQELKDLVRFVRNSGKIIK